MTQICHRWAIGERVCIFDRSGWRATYKCRGSGALLPGGEEQHRTVLKRGLTGTDSHGSVQHIYSGRDLDRRPASVPHNLAHKTRCRSAQSHPLGHQDLDSRCAEPNSPNVTFLGCPIIYVSPFRPRSQGGLSVRWRTAASLPCERLIGISFLSSDAVAGGPSWLCIHTAQDEQTNERPARL